jgi:hypothetical protein
MNTTIIRTFVLTALFWLIEVATTAAQCPMCRMSAESNMKNGGTAGAGLNAGILYMLVAPYLIVAGVAYWWWRNRKADAEDATTITPADLLRPDDATQSN